MPRVRVTQNWSNESQPLHFVVMNAEMCIEHVCMSGYHLAKRGGYIG